MNKKSLKIILAAVCLTVVAILLLPVIFGSISGDEISTDEEAVVPVEPVEPESIDISILCAGDVMAHLTQIEAALQSDGTYDFTENYTYIKDYISSADVAICNVETTFGGTPYTGYPAFSAPDELAACLANVGFDVVCTANNHMLDRGKDGLVRTREHLEAKGFEVTGSIVTTDQPRYAMYQAKGVDIAVIGYTYQTPTSNRVVAINGSQISSELAQHINSFGYEYIDEELAKINGTVEAARAAGADLVIMFYHWGEEYQLASNQWQQYMAEKTVETMDIDVIFGSHPHVLQEMVTLTSPNGRQIPVYYSLGNLVSNQRTETLDIPNDKYTEQGALAVVEFSVTLETGEKELTKVDVIPTWVDRYKVDGKFHYNIIPLDDNLQSNEVFAVSGHLDRAVDALEEANGLLRNTQ